MEVSTRYSSLESKFHCALIHAQLVHPGANKRPSTDRATLQDYAQTKAQPRRRVYKQHSLQAAKCNQSAIKVPMDHTMHVRPDPCRTAMAFGPRWGMLHMPPEARSVARADEEQACGLEVWGISMSPRCLRDSTRSSAARHQSGRLEHFKETPRTFQQEWTNRAFQES